MVLEWNNVCGNSSLFWDWNLIWNSTFTHFPDCFHNTVLIWFPFGFLWLCLPFEIYTLRNSRSGFVPWSVISVTKIVFCGCLVCLFIVEFSNVLFAHSQGKSILTFEIYNPIIKALTLFACIILVHSERMYGIQFSYVLASFWALVSFAGAFTYFSLLGKTLNEFTLVDENQFTVFMIYYPLSLAQFGIHLVRDVEPLYTCMETETDLKAPLLQNEDNSEEEIIDDSSLR